MPRLADASVLAGIEADRVAALVANQLLRVNQVEAAFVGQDLAACFAANVGHGGIVAGRGRLFNEREPTIGQRAHAVNRGGGVPTAVGVDDQIGFGANRFADDAHALHVVLGPASHLDFNGGE